MSEKHTGSCLCGAVRYEVDGSFERFYLCHCSRCRKNTGSAHAANLFSSTAKLTWLSGEDRITTYRVPGTRHARNFCASCGSALPLGSRHLLVVPAGSLDTEVSLPPDGNIFSTSRASWDHDLASAREFDGFPP
ncbi:MAG: GFA family protein [Gammaproteobacteria bacterium PRO9]|nr:GFA family protein [Gammaproteobacteria bacterium PRO9]